LLLGLAVLGVTALMHRREASPPGPGPAAPSPGGGASPGPAALEALFDDVPSRWSRGEVVTMIVFLLAVIGWMLPGRLELIAWLGAQLMPRAEAPSAAAEAIASRVDAALPSAAVALFAASILFMVPDGEGQRVLPWPRANRIDWGIIMLFGGGIALG